MKNKILDMLYENIEKPLSGQLMSGNLGISRTAVWKHIKTLIAEGYKITSSGGKGYILETGGDVLNEYELRRRISSEIPVVFRKTIGSTNNLAKRTAGEANDEFMLVTAEKQEAGRGRLGRSFESNSEKGVWCSFILKPGISPESALIMTVAAATAVCKTIQEVSGHKAGIKWPNDIISSNKKICGILSEMSCETGIIEYIVVGIGINVLQNTDDFSPEVSQIATSILTETGVRCNRAEIITALCYNIQEIYNMVKTGNIELIIKRWSEYSVTDGKTIKIVKNGQEITALAEGIDHQGRLVTINSDGEKNIYNSGEISVRGIMGYI